MNVLIVEDDLQKLSQIRRAIQNQAPSLSIEIAMSLQEAFEKLLASRFSLVFLDMAIPSHSTEQGVSDVYSQPVGGLDVLIYLSRSKRNERVMILTQYPTIEYNRKHMALKSFMQNVRTDGVDNLSAVAIFAEGSDWRDQVNTFLAFEQ